MPHITEEKREAIVRALRQGLGPTAIRASLHVGLATVSRVARDIGVPRKYMSRKHVVEPPPLIGRELWARLADIPDDTRNLTARICGDPLPGRSALDRRLS